MKTLSGRTIPLWATVFTVLSIAILCSLGAWQLQRLQWKEGLIARIAAEQTRDPLQNRIGIAELKSGQDLNFVRGAVKGRFLHMREIPLGPRTYNGEPGYHIFTPLELDGGGTILVNRGWVPQALKTPSSRASSLVGGDILVAGTFYTPENANFFVPQNSPQTNEWYRLNLAQIASVRHLEDLAPFVLYAEVAPTTSEYPLMEATHRSLRNQHLQYAFFWFSMAGILAVIYALRFLAGRRQ